MLHATTGNRWKYVYSPNVSGRQPQSGEDGSKENARRGVNWWHVTSSGAVRNLIGALFIWGRRDLKGDARGNPWFDERGENSLARACTPRLREKNTARWEQQRKTSRERKCCGQSNRGYCSNSGPASSSVVCEKNAKHNLYYWEGRQQIYRHGVRL